MRDNPNLLVKMYRARWSYLFLLPSLTAFTLFFLVPIIYTFYISFNQWSTLSSPKFVGMGNYIGVVSDAVFWKAIRNTAVYVLMVVPSIVVMSLIVAVLVNIKTRAQNFFKILYYIPVICSGIVVGIIWKWIYNGEIGVLNYILSLFGLPKTVWLGSTSTALASIAVVGIWRSVGYYMIIYLAGLQSIPPQLYEAARMDGASEFQNFLYITLPMLRPITVLVLILATISTFQVFEMIYVMTYGGPAESTITAVWQIYIASFTQFKFGYAASMGFVLFLFVFIISLFQLRYSKSEVFGS